MTRLHLEFTDEAGDESFVVLECVFEPGADLIIRDVWPEQRSFQLGLLLVALDAKNLLIRRQIATAPATRHTVIPLSVSWLEPFLTDTTRYHLGSLRNRA